ncbi:MAG: potassium channel family protein [Rhizobiaceae bacterium]|nr:potassium channel family protein [Rhizobiaceae bacterium]
MVAQILWGSLVLGLCTLVHLFIVIGWVQVLRRSTLSRAGSAKLVKQFMVVGITLAAIIFAHTVQVWIWAGALVGLGALQSFPDALYFALVTYTTVGYGDLTIGPDFRIFGAMAAVTGMLGFGISTAFLVGLLGRLFPNHLK